MAENNEAAKAPIDPNWHLPARSGRIGFLLAAMLLAMPIILGRCCGLKWLDVVCLTLSAILVCKLVDIAAHTVFVVRDGGEFARQLLSSKNDVALFGETLKRYAHVWWRGREPISGCFLSAAEMIDKSVYRWPLLVMAQAAVLMVMLGGGPDHGEWHHRVVVLAILALLLNAVLEVLHHILNRIYMTYAESFARKYYWIEVRSHPKPIPSDITLPRDERIKHFILVFAVLVTAVVFTFAGIYSGLQHLSESNFQSETGIKDTSKAFDGIAHSKLNPFGPPLELIYFSVVTMATVGYGDIRPANLVARLFVSSQICVNIMLFVFLLTTFSMTMDPEEPRK